jgi:hypothetical protein
MDYSFEFFSNFVGLISISDTILIKEKKKVLLLIVRKKKYKQSRKKMVNKKKVNQFTFFSKLYFIFVLFAKMHGQKLFTIKTISQRHFDTSSHIYRLSKMNISKYQ